MALKHYLLDLGFTNSLSKTSLFTHQFGNHSTYILVYVDDIIVTGSNLLRISDVLRSLANRFLINYPVDLHYFLGIEVTRTSLGLHDAETIHS